MTGKVLYSAAFTACGRLDAVPRYSSSSVNSNGSCNGRSCCTGREGACSRDTDPVHTGAPTFRPNNLSLEAGAGSDAATGRSHATCPTHDARSAVVGMGIMDSAAAWPVVSAALSRRVHVRPLLRPALRAVQYMCASNGAYSANVAEPRPLLDVLVAQSLCDSAAAAVCSRHWQPVTGCRAGVYACVPVCTQIHRTHMKKLST